MGPARKSSSSSAGSVRAVSVSPRAGRVAKAAPPLRKASRPPSPAKAPNARPAHPVGATVARRFGGAWFEGRVVAKIEPEAGEADRAPWFRVVYDDDGDAEDLTRAEVAAAIDAHADHAKLEAGRRDAVALPPRADDPYGGNAADVARVLYEAIDLRVLAPADVEMSRTARLLLALKPRNSPPAPDKASRRKARRAAAAPRPAPPPPGPKPVAPSRFRKNHQAQSKPPMDADGNFPCARGCGRTFTHAPAAVAHTKACRYGCPPCA